MLFGKKKKETVETAKETKSLDELNKDYEETFADVDSSDVSSWSEDEYNRIAKIKDSFERGLITEEEIPEVDQEKIMKLYNIEINKVQGDIKVIQEENKMYEEQINEMKKNKSLEELNSAIDTNSQEISSWPEDEYNRIAKLKDSFERGLITEEEIPEEDKQKIMKLYNQEINDIRAEIKVIQEENKMFEKKINELKEKYQVNENLEVSKNSSIEENIKVNEGELNALKENMVELEKKDIELLKENVKKRVNLYPEVAKKAFKENREMFLEASPELYKEMLEKEEEETNE